MRPSLLAASPRALSTSMHEIEASLRARLLSWPTRALLSAAGDSGVTTIAERTGQLSDSVTRAWLFARLFPDPFRAAMQNDGALMPNDDSGSGHGSGMGMSPLEHDFFSHLGSLFPVDEALVDAWADDGALPRFIPVAVASHPLIEEGLNGGEPTPVLVLASLLELINRDEAAMAITQRPDRPSALPPLSSPAEFDFTAFKALCVAKHDAERDAMWQSLPAAISVLARDTGNPFLDAWLEEYDWLCKWASDSTRAGVDGDGVARSSGWTVENMRRLARAWRSAEALWNQYEAAVDWLEREPEHWPEIFAMWAACTRHRDEAGGPRP